MSRAATRQGYALATLAGGFFVAATLKAGMVVAALPQSQDDGFGRPLPSARGAATDVAGQPAAEAASAGTMNLIAELRRRRDALSAQEEKLAERELLLEAIERRLNRRLDEMEAARAKLEDMAVIVDDAAGKDVRHLAAMYSQMKPKQAAQIFNLMPPSFAAGFLGEMEAAQASLIMANMEAEKAYAVSLLLAGRNVSKGN